MLVTLIVDASYYDKPRTAAWACWAISELGKFRYSAVFYKRMENNVAAELAAITNALHIVMPRPMCHGAKRVLIQSDCVGALGMITKADTARKHYGPMVEHILKTAEKYGVDLATRHVKGHAGIGEPRNFCQDWCDREARRLARARRDARIKELYAKP